MTAAMETRRKRAELLDGAMENRQFGAVMELREAGNGTLAFTGYASVTETPYEIGDFVETIARSAFKRTISEAPDVVLLVNHTGLPLARTKSGTMRLAEDDRGYRVDADLDREDPDVMSLVPKMRRGDLTEMSFSFRVTDQEWSQDYSQRRIRSVTVHRGDVSIVTMGANPATSASVRAARRANIDYVSMARQELDVLMAQEGFSSFEEWRRVNRVVKRGPYAAERAWLEQQRAKARR